MSQQTEGKTALVTGGGSGIGRAVALALQGAGYNVVLAGRKAEPLEKTMSNAAPDGGRMLSVPTDVAKAEDVGKLFDACVGEFGRLDVLFNNAGISAPPVAMDELTFAQWQAVVDVNLTGVFVCCQHAMRIMKNQTPKGGRIINNGSISAYVPRPLSAPYTATKHAITGLTKCIALDGRTDNIACSQIDIGNAATEMTEPMKAGIMQPDGSLKVESRMDVAHVANAVLYMANLPLDANVLNMTIKATDMPFEGRG
ncbi:MAG: SDR family oxidoreductase [Hyphomicrobiaceae bacterium]